VRQSDLLQLEQIAAGYPSRERFLTELTLDPPDATSDQAGMPLLDEDYLILSTIHSAKGQEWKSVFVLNVVDGCIPSDLGAGTTAEIEEERRLLYVAMTRAKDSLHLIVPQRFFAQGQNSQGDRHVYASRTRFIPATLVPPDLAGSSEHPARTRRPKSNSHRCRCAHAQYVAVKRLFLCNLYSLTKGQQAIREWAGVMNDRTGNLPPLPDIFPDYAAPIVRNQPAPSQLRLDLRRQHAGVHDQAVD